MWISELGLGRPRTSSNPEIVFGRKNPRSEYPNPKCSVGCSLCLCVSVVGVLGLLEGVALTSPSFWLAGVKNRGPQPVARIPGKPRVRTCGEKWTRWGAPGMSQLVQVLRQDFCLDRLRGLKLGFEHPPQRHRDTEENWDCGFRNWDWGVCGYLRIQKSLMASKIRDPNSQIPNVLCASVPLW